MEAYSVQIVSAQARERGETLLGPWALLEREHVSIYLSLLPIMKYVHS